MERSMALAERKNQNPNKSKPDPKEKKSSKKGKKSKNTEEQEDKTKTEETQEEIVPDPLKEDAKILPDLVSRSSIISAFESDGSRWFLLVSVALLNFSNTCSWIAYAPVGNYVNALYGEESAAWFSMIYMFVSVPFGFIGMYIGSKNTLNVPLIAACVLNAIGALIRALSTQPQVDPQNRFPICLLGQSIAAMAYPFIMFLPSKISATCFPPSQRTIATTIGVMANPLGVMVVNLVAPLIVQSSDDVWILNVILFIICFVALFFAGCSLGCLKPDETKQRKSNDYATSCGSVFGNLNYDILMFALGGGIGMFNSLYTMMLQMMCPSGYGNQVAGICAVLMIGCGMIGATVASIYVDKHKNYRTAMIVLMNFAVIFGVGFLWMSKVPNMSLILFFISGAFGFCGLAAYPVGLELAIECTYPAAPEVSSGFIVLVGQLFSVLIVAIIKIGAKSLSFVDSDFGVEACRAHAEDAINVPKNYDNPIIIITFIAVLIAIVVWFLREDYRRLRREMTNAPNRTRTTVSTTTIVGATTQESDPLNPSTSEQR